MLTNTYMKNSMKLTADEISKITKEEYEELQVLRRAINDNISSVHPDKQERFTHLFVKSLSYVVDAG